MRINNGAPRSSHWRKAPAPIDPGCATDPAGRVRPVPEARPSGTFGQNHTPLARDLDVEPGDVARYAAGNSRQSGNAPARVIAVRAGHHQVGRLPGGTITATFDLANLGERPREVSGGQERQRQYCRVEEASSRLVDQQAIGELPERMPIGQVRGKRFILYAFGTTSTGPLLPLTKDNLPKPSVEWGTRPVA